MSTLLLAPLLGEVELEPSLSVVSPPPVGSCCTFQQVPVLQLQRYQRSATQIQLRAEQVIAAFAEFDVELHDPTVQQWAAAAVANPDRFAWTHPVVDHPNIALGYHRQYDDVVLIDTYLWDLERGVGPGGPQNDIGQPAALLVFEDALEELQLRGVIDTCMDASTATVAPVREWVQVDGGSSVSWVSEYQFTVNCEVSGFEVLDAGVRLGVHRTGYISSLRVTDIQRTLLGHQATALTWIQAKNILAGQLAQQYPGSQLRLIGERPATMLNASLTAGIVRGGYFADYALIFSGGQSRARMAHVSLVNGAVTNPDEPAPLP